MPTNAKKIRPHHVIVAETAVKFLERVETVRGIRLPLKKPLSHAVLNRLNEDAMNYFCGAATCAIAADHIRLGKALAATVMAMSTRGGFIYVAELVGADLAYL